MKRLPGHSKLVVIEIARSIADCRFRNGDNWHVAYLSSDDEWFYADDNSPVRERIISWMPIGFTEKVFL